MVWVWNAFQILSGRRNYGMGAPNPISLESMFAYCQLSGIYKIEDTDFLLTMIPILDEIWMTDWIERSERERNKKAKKK